VSVSSLWRVEHITRYGWRVVSCYFDLRVALRDARRMKRITEAGYGAYRVRRREGGKTFVYII